MVTSPSLFLFIQESLLNSSRAPATETATSASMERQRWPDVSKKPAYDSDAFQYQQQTMEVVVGPIATTRNQRHAAVVAATLVESTTTITTDDTASANATASSDRPISSPSMTLKASRSRSGSTSNAEYNFARYYLDAPPCQSIPPLQASQIGFTLVTQSSLDRLWIIKYQCARWKGPISLAVFIASDDDRWNNETVTTPTME
jgi:Glycosyl-transferase for dystroglycan